jgi:hypothetical protein
MKARWCCLFFSKVTGANMGTPLASQFGAIALDPVSRVLDLVQIFLSPLETTSTIYDGRVIPLEIMPVLAIHARSKFV